MLLAGNAARGTSLLQLGELRSATQHLEKALAVFDLRQPLPAVLEAQRMGSFLFLSQSLYRLGYPDRALAISREMMEVAQRSSVPYVLAQAPCFAAAHHLARGDDTAAQRCAEEAMARI
jgi:tetratricopeptide (TPR) repeat protein